MISKQFIDGVLRVAVKRLWRSGPAIADLRDKAARADGWLARVGGVVAATPIDVAGVPAEWVGAEATAARGVLLYLHGGAFCLHLPNGYRQLVHRLAQQTGMRVLLPDYRLAPEHPLPAGLDDCCAAYRWLIDQGFPAARIAIAGDSAGGNLTLAVLMRARDQGLPMPACAVLMSPVTDFTGGSPSIESNEDSDVLFTRHALGLVQGHYLAGTPADDPAASPLFGQWAGLPPMLFHVSGSEMLRDDSLRAVECAHAAGVEAQVKVWPDMPHVFQLIGLLPETRQSLDEIGSFISAHSGLQAQPKVGAAANNGLKPQRHFSGNAALTGNDAV